MNHHTKSAFHDGDPMEVTSRLARNLSEIDRVVESGGKAFVPVEAFHAGAMASSTIIQAGKAFLIWIARGAIAPVEVLLRYQIGERYHNPVVTIVAVAIIVGLHFANIFSQAMMITLLVVFALGRAVHSLACFARDRIDLYWHSYYEGQSWLRVGPVDRFLGKWYFTFDFSKLVLEPLVLLIAANIAGLVMPAKWVFLPQILGGGRFKVAPLGVYLSACAVILLLYQIYCWGHRRTVALNEKDAFAELDARKQVHLGGDGSPRMQVCRGVAFLPRRTQLDWEGATKGKSMPQKIGIVLGKLAAGNRASS